MNDPSDLLVTVHCSELDDAQLASRARNLRESLLKLDVVDVRATSAGPPPAGAKAGELIAVAALVVSLTPASAGAVLDVVTSWLRRQPTDIEVEIEGAKLKGTVTREQRDALVQAYLQRVAEESAQR